jgi:hypothetical protein
LILRALSDALSDSDDWEGDVNLEEYDDHTPL